MVELLCLHPGTPIITSLSSFTSTPLPPWKEGSIIYELELLYLFTPWDPYNYPASHHHDPERQPTRRSDQYQSFLQYHLTLCFFTITTLHLATPTRTGLILPKSGSNLHTWFISFHCTFMILQVSVFLYLVTYTLGLTLSGKSYYFYLQNFIPHYVYIKSVSKYTQYDLINEHWI